MKLNRDHGRNPIYKRGCDRGRTPFLPEKTHSQPPLMKEGSMTTSEHYDFHDEDAEHEAFLLAALMRTRDAARIQHVNRDAYCC